jgi:erythromycin esterase-like protein
MLQELDPILKRINSCRFALLGEASHGTVEYYRQRFEISKKLIEEQGFQFIGVEGDWPHCFAINRYVKGYSNQDQSAEEALKVFDRWPSWMWANEEMTDFVSWLKNHNADLPFAQKVGFYGLDLYSLLDSLVAIINFLKKEDPGFLHQAYQTYQCFKPYSTDMHNYGFASELTRRNCTAEVLQLLQKMPQDFKLGDSETEEKFSARQNALAVKNAENYYRSVLQSNSESWNVRDRHMMESLSQIADFYGPDSKGIVWAHNTHIGDARFTDMHRAGMINIGELARKKFLHNVVLVGFGSYQGSVIASDRWDGPVMKMKVPKAMPGSWESALHDYFEGSDGLIVFDSENQKTFDQTKGNRAIGVVYNPEVEYGNYVPTMLSKRYDVFYFIDQTSALHPLEVPVKVVEVDETFPSGV